MKYTYEWNNGYGVILKDGKTYVTIESFGQAMKLLAQTAEGADLMGEGLKAIYSDEMEEWLFDHTDLNPLSYDKHTQAATIARALTGTLLGTQYYPHGQKYSMGDLLQEVLSTVELPKGLRKRIERTLAE